MPSGIFLTACLLQVGVIWILILPIWGFLPQNTPTLAPVQIEVSWYPAPQELPRISLPAAKPKTVIPEKKTEAAEHGADAFNPKQTILSIPVRITQPRQTLIRPDAPAAPPKVVPQMPNIVQWAAVNIAKPKPQYSPAVSAPVVRQRTVRDVAAPVLPNLEKNPAAINIASKPATIPKPKMPLSAMTAPIAPQRQAHSNEEAAPDIGGSASEGDSSMRMLIALSATPGPPAPVSSIPEGNLAARISISPDGKKPGEGGTSANGAAGMPGGENASGGSGTGKSAIAGGAGTSSLPAAISITGGEALPGNGGANGGITSAGNRPGKLDLIPRTPYEPSATPRNGPANVAALDPNLPPEKILGSEVYTLHVNLPDLTSASGSWILSFAELDEGQLYTVRKKDPLAAPVPLETVDPKYPPELIKGHVHGEVVLYAIIRKDGSVDSIQVVRTLEPQLDRNAIDALGKGKFRPAARAGSPVDIEVVVHIPFSYTDPRY